MALRPSSVPQRVPLPSPPASSLADGPDPESDLLRAASPTVPRLLAIVVTGPSFESTTASALVVELVDFVVACCIVAESEFDSPPSVGGECALSTDVLEERVKRPSGSPSVFKARYVARGFSQRHGVGFFQTFSPTPKMTTLRGSLHEEIWLRRPPGFTGSFPAGPSALRLPELPPQSTPLPTGHSLSAPPSCESVELSGPYPELVGCLMYLMTCTRPDLAYPLSILACYIAPGRHRPEHWKAAK
ncbi:unnamed protein product, partial [Closterium sp. NIES-53]